MGSFGLYIVLLFIIAAGILMIVINPLINETIDVVNLSINDGLVSAKYVTYFNLTVGLGKAMAVFILLGVTGWGIVRALEKRDTGGA